MENKKLYLLPVVSLCILLACGCINNEYLSEPTPAKSGKTDNALTDEFQEVTDNKGGKQAAAGETPSTTLIIEKINPVREIEFSQGTPTTIERTATTYIVPPTTVIDPADVLEDDVPAITLGYTPPEPPEGSEPLDISGDGFLAGFGGYKFQLDNVRLMDDITASAIRLNVQTPQGVIVQGSLGWDECNEESFDYRVGDTVLRLSSVSGSVYEPKARIYAWDYSKVNVFRKKTEPVKPHPNARLISGVSTEGFTGEYDKYRFKLDQLIYAEDYVIAGAVLNVQRPDGTVKNVQVSQTTEGGIDNLKIRFVCGSAEDIIPIQVMDIYVWE